jgi:hypothetical protein
MADSDNTRVCASVTRRKFLSATMAMTAALPFQTAGTAAGALAGNPAFDPALALWYEWRAAYRSTAEMCRKQQRLETRLINRVGFPRAEVFLPDEDMTVTVHGPEHIEELFGHDPSWVATRAKAEADLAAYQTRWDAADRELGYSAAKREEQDAADHEQDLFDTLTYTPATSLAGVAGKLHAILREGESWEDCSDFPWPQVRSVLVDVVRLGQAMQSDASMPGADRKSPYQRKRRNDCCFRVGKGPSVSGS